MSIASEIKRLQDAKSSIKASIENKGVVVGEGTIDTYASKIDEITMGTTEDLTDELTEQNNLITIQKNALIEAFTKLQGKAAGGSGGNVLPTIEENTLVFSTGIVEGGVLSI